MIRTRFNDVQEYIKEISLDRTDVEQEIVRITYEYTPLTPHPGIQSLALVATAIVRGRVVKLKHDVGTFGLSRDEDEVVLTKGSEARVTLASALIHYGLTIRNGVYEEVGNP